MKSRKLRFALLAVFGLIFASFAHAKWVWTPETGWFRVQTEIRGTPEQNFADAKKLMDDGDYEAASKAFVLFARAFPDLPYTEEARYLGGEAAYQADDPAKAYKLFNSYLAKYPQGTYRGEVLARQFDIGCAFLGGKWRKVAGLKIMPPFDLPERVFSDIIRLGPYSDLADDAQLKLGEFYLSRQRYEQAERAFEKLIETWPGSELVPLARYQIAVANMMRSQGESYNPRLIGEAAETLKDYRARYGAKFEGEVVENLLRELTEGQALQQLRVARFYLKRKKPEAARVYFKATIKDFPGTDAAAAAEAVLEFMKERRKPGEIARFLDQEIEGKSSAGSARETAARAGENEGERGT